MNKLRLQLTILSFLQFFVWGTWLTSIAVYLTGPELNFNGTQTGSVFSTLGIAALFMPGLLGIIADKYISADKVYAACHLLGAAALYSAAGSKTPDSMYLSMLVNSLVYMPTIALSNSISYQLLSRAGLDVIKVFPPIRVWGTIGFIAAMWATDWFGWSSGANQLMFGAGSSFFLGLFALTLPNCDIYKDGSRNWKSALGIDALKLFKNRNLAVFFLFAMLIGAALQITNLWGQTFIRDFETVAEFRNSFAVQHPGILLSVSQISETVFILTIPFFLKRFGIRTVMLFSILAWFARFMLFSTGDPGSGFIFLILSMLVYGMAFDFFNISGSLFVEQETPANIRSSAQGLFMIMTNGLGSILGGLFSGFIVDVFTSPQGRSWPEIWISFGIYSAILAILFLILFRSKT